MALVNSYPLPKLQRLPSTLPKEGAISITLEEGVPIFRASGRVQKHILSLLDKQKLGRITKSESEELDRYEMIDDYLSHLNRIVRNQSYQAQSL